MSDKQARVRAVIDAVTALLASDGAAAVPAAAQTIARVESTDLHPDAFADLPPRIPCHEAAPLRIFPRAFPATKRFWIRPLAPYRPLLSNPCVSVWSQQRTIYGGSRTTWNTIHRNQIWVRATFRPTFIHCWLDPAPVASTTMILPWGCLCLGLGRCTAIISMTRQKPTSTFRPAQGGVSTTATGKIMALDPSFLTRPMPFTRHAAMKRHSYRFFRGWMTSKANARLRRVMIGPRSKRSSKRLKPDKTGQNQPNSTCGAPDPSTIYGGFIASPIQLLYHLGVWSKAACRCILCTGL